MIMKNETSGLDAACIGWSSAGGEEMEIRIWAGCFFRSCYLRLRCATIVSAYP